MLSTKDTLRVFDDVENRLVWEVGNASGIRNAAWSHDGRGLIARTEEARRLLYIDLCGIRRDLRELGLDWNCDAIPSEPAPEMPIPKIDVIRRKTPVAKPVPPSAQKLLLEAQVYARQRLWELVAPKLEAACQVGPSDHWPFYQLAILYAYLGDEPSYVRVANQMSKQFGDSADRTVLERLALVLALSRNGEADFRITVPAGIQVEVQKVTLHRSPARGAAAK